MFNPKPTWLDFLKTGIAYGEQCPKCWGITVVESGHPGQVLIFKNNIKILIYSHV